MGPTSSASSHKLKVADQAQLVEPWQSCERLEMVLCVNYEDMSTRRAWADQCANGHSERDQERLPTATAGRTVVAEEGKEKRRNSKGERWAPQ